MKIVKKIATGITLALAIASNAFAVESANEKEGINIAKTLIESLSPNFCRNFPPYCPMVSDTLVSQKSEPKVEEGNKQSKRK